MTIFIDLKRYCSRGFVLSLLIAALSPQIAIAKHHLPHHRTYIPPSEKFSDLSESTPSVQALSNLYPTDWQYLQFQRLAERYLVPSRIMEQMRQQSAVSRQEFAVALASLLDHFVKQKQPLSRGEKDILQSLQRNFSAELALLAQRTDRLTNNLENLEKTQFSTVTQLQGEVLFATFGIGGDPVDDNPDIGDRRITFGYRARLNLNTSFTGRDRLRLRLQASSTGDVDDATGTNMTRPSFQSDTDGELILNRLDYQFPIGKKTEVWIEAVGGSLSNFTEDLNPELSSSSRGTISRFGVRNPIYRHSGSTGVGINHEFGKGFVLALGYLADDAEDPEEGLFGGAYGAVAQLAYKPSDKFGIGLTYVRSFNALDNNIGSERSNNPFNEASEAIAANSFGLQSTVEIAPKVRLSGWVGFTRAQASDLPDDPSANIINWATSLSVLDLGTEGSLLGIIVGQPPKLIQNQYEVDGSSYIDPSTSLHLETFYKWPVNENIAITAGIIVITNPEHNAANDTNYIGVVRTLFRF
jgi:hypothetical protein